MICSFMAWDLVPDSITLFVDVRPAFSGLQESFPLRREGPIEICTKTLSLKPT